MTVLPLILVDRASISTTTSSIDQSQSTIPAAIVGVTRSALLGYCPNMTINPAPKTRSAPNPINEIGERFGFEPVAMMLGNRYSPRSGRMGVIVLAHPARAMPESALPWSALGSPDDRRRWASLFVMRCSCQGWQASVRCRGAATRWCIGLRR